MKTGKEFVLTSAFKISPTVCTTFRHEFHTFLSIILSVMSLQGLRLNKVGFSCVGMWKHGQIVKGEGRGGVCLIRKRDPVKQNLVHSRVTLAYHMARTSPRALSL